MERRYCIVHHIFFSFVRTVSDGKGRYLRQRHRLAGRLDMSSVRGSYIDIAVSVLLEKQK